MGLSFLAPAFFAALAALAIPILVHLTHRSRREVVRFPSLRFLDQVPYRAVRRQRIRHWALFLARCLALVLLALAFARPLLDRVGRAGGAGTGGTETVLLLDRSYSMGYGDHWQRAVAAARAVTDAIGPEDRASIVTFGEDASLSVEGTSDPTLLRLALDSLTPGAGRTRFAPALQVARQILDQSRLPNRDVVLISDFQDQGWERSTDVSLPPGAAFRTVDLSVTEPINVLLSNARIQRGERGGREEVFVLARVVNQGDAPVRGLPVDLEVDGTPVNRQVASVEPRSAATVRFGPIAQPSAVARATVRSAVDSLPLDNAFHFVLPPRPTISILIVEGAGRGSRSALYLRQALRISHEPAFLVESKLANQLRPGDLSGRAIVILNDCPFPSGAAGRALIEFVRDGGGLLTVLGSKSAMSSWPAEARDLLPGTWGAPVDRLRTQGVALGTIEYAHPVFAIFTSPESGDLSAPRFYRYRPVQLDSLGTVLARFSDGSVAAAERMFGKGKTLLWTSALDNLWNDFPIQPVYLPLIHQMARHLSGRRVDPPFFGAGQILDLSNYADRLGAGDEAAPLEIVVETPSGERVSKSTGGEDRFLLLDEPGFYAIRPAGRRITAYPIAVNADRAESDLNALDPEEFSAAVTASVDTEEREAIALAALTPEERERRQGLWWYMLVIALVVLVAESIASNRLPFIAPTERPQEASRG
jgi:hypothetical protein